MTFLDRAAVADLLQAAEKIHEEHAYRSRFYIGKGVLSAQVLEIVLAAGPEGIRCRALSDRIQRAMSETSQVLRRLVLAGKVRKVRRGLYVRPE